MQWMWLSLKSGVSRSKSDKEKNKSKVICDELQEVMSSFHIIISLVKLFAHVLNHL